MIPEFYKKNPILLLGMEVKIIADRAGHGYSMNKIVKINGLSEISGSSFKLRITDGNSNNGYTALEGDVELVQPIKEEIKKKIKGATDLKTDLERQLRYMEETNTNIVDYQKYNIFTLSEILQGCKNKKETAEILEKYNIAGIIRES